MQMNESVVVEKMNLVLEAAGMSTKLYSFDQLAQGAPVLFINAFEPLFEHGIRGLHHTPNNLAEHELNCGLLLDEIRRKVEPDRLLSSSGRKLVSGDKLTIATLVDIYCERSEYMRTRFDEYLLAPPKVIHPKHRMLKKDSSKKRLVAGAEPAGKAENPVEIIQNLQQYVAALEQKLESYEHDNKNKSGDKKKRHNSRDPPRSRKATDVERARQDAELGIQEDETESVARVVSSEPPRDSKERSRERPKSGLRPGSAKTRPKRPSSAPAKRAPVASGADSDQLHVKASRSGAGGLASASAHDHAPPPSGSPKRNPRPWSSAPYRPPKVDYLNNPVPESNYEPHEKIEPFDPEIHTFDMRSGRRILKVDAEKYKAKNQSNGIVKEMEDFKDHNNPRSSADRADRPPEPTMPVWPGARTERSVREYIQKSKVARIGPDKLPPGTLPAARLLSAYGNLQDCDMLVTVEHCTNCQYHNTTLRHDEDHYCAEADTMLKNLAAAIHDFNPCIRLGVMRFAANVTPKSRDSDANSRIGAFEVQIAFRNLFGELSKEMLHSKLSSRRWPSKSVTQKRLSAFLSKVKVSQHREPGKDDHYDLNDEDVGYTTVSCPTGIGHWSELPMSSTAWSYVNMHEPAPAAPVSSSPRGKPHNQAGGIYEVAGDNEDASIEWVFDARQVGETALFSNGDIVWVSKFGGERHPLLGTVVKADGKNAAMERVVTVHLNYVDTSIVVPEGQCESRGSYRHPLPQYGIGDFPIHLLVLFTHGKETLKWHKSDPSDVTVKNTSGHDQYLLCRKSIFQQLKELAMSVEKAKRGRGTFLVPNVNVGEPGVDLQLCYSEHILDWICQQNPNADGLINMNLLVERIVPTPPDSPRKIPSPTKLSPRESPAKKVPISSTLAEKAAAETLPSTDRKIVEQGVKQTPRPLLDAAASAALSLHPEDEPVVGNIVAGSVRAFVDDLLKWCDRSIAATAAANHDRDLSPRSKLKRSTVHLRRLFTTDGSEFGETNSLDVIQFSLALEKLGLVCTTDVLMGLLATFDDDGNGLLQYDELVAFLEDESPNKFSLGDIWVNVRSVLIKEDKGKKVYKIGELSEELLSICTDGGDEIPESTFKQVLQKYKLLEADIISEADQKMLFSMFAGQKSGKSFLISSKYLNVGKFLAWLNPVDVMRTSKRIAKSIDWFAARQTVKKTRKNVVEQIVGDLISDAITPAQPSPSQLASVVPVGKLLEVMYTYQIPMSRAEGRAFSKYFKHTAGNVLRVCECVAVLMGSLVIESEVIAVSSSPYEEETQTPSAEANAFNFSGEFDNSSRMGVTTVDSNNFDIIPSADREEDQLGSKTQISDKSALDMCVDMLEITGSSLVKQIFDRTGVVLSCGALSVNTAFSRSRQKGTDSRLLDVRGKNILLLDLATDPKPSLKAELFIKDDDDAIPVLMGSTSHFLENDIKLYNHRSDDQSGSAKVTFEIDTAEGSVTVHVNVHFIESKSSVANRIRKMSSQDLSEFRFQPLSNELDDDDEESGLSAHHQLPQGISFGLSSLENIPTPSKDTKN